MAFLSVLIASGFTVFAVFEDSRKAMKEQLIIEADYVKTAYESLGVEYLDGLNRSIGGRITVIEKDGKVIYDSIADADKLDNHRDRQEFIEALKGGSGYAARNSETLHEITYYYAAKLADGNVIRVACTSSTLNGTVLALLPWTITIIVITSLLAVLLSNFVTKHIVAPINKINLDAPRENEVYEEISPLLVRMEKQRMQINLQMQELAQKQKEFSAITENMSEGLIVVDGKSEVLSYNRGALELCGYTGGLGTGTSVFVINRDIAFCQAVESCLKGQKCEHSQIISGRNCRFYLSPVETDQGVSGAVIVIMDRTEEENREELRREFTANVSHELKTPLTSISGYAEIIKNGIAKEKDIPGFAGKIYMEAQRLIALVADIIKLSRLDEAEGTLQKEDCDLYSIAATAVKRLEPSSQAAGVEISVTGDVAPIKGVPSMLEEMVYNLCDNGIKYNRQGGAVIVSVAARPGGAVLKVRDTGMGIPKEDRERIFERFYRVDKSHSRETGGTGLGLSIVKHCVLLHGGEIKLESTLGEGTTMTVLLK